MNYNSNENSEGNISSSAKICPNAKIGNNVRIGDFSYIGSNVKLGDNISIGNNVIIEGNTTIGNNTKIFHYVIIGTPPQDKKFSEEKNYIYIGENNIIREFTTIHLPTNENHLSLENAMIQKQGITYIGNNNFLMTGSHIAHNCIVGNNIVFANNTALAGHCNVYDNANIGAFVIVHQFTQIGEFSMIGSGFRVSKDVVPWGLGAGYNFKIVKVNSIGLRRNGFSSAEINKIKDIYKILFWSSNNVTQAVEKLKEFKDCKYAKRMIEFINNSKRGIIK